MSATTVDEHLEQCPACRLWWVEASDLTRTIRVRRAVEVPDVVAAVMAYAPPVPTRRQLRYRALRTHWPRVALTVVAAVQVILGLAQVCGFDYGMLPHGDNAAMGARSADAMSVHLFNETTAWALAVGFGLLWVARKPARAGGMLPVLSVFVAVLTAFVIHDALAGDVTVVRIISHGLLVVALALLVVVHHRYHRPHLPTPGYAVSVGSGLSRSRRSVETAPDRRGPNGTPPLRPAGRYVA